MKIPQAIFAHSLLVVLAVAVPAAAQRTPAQTVASVKYPPATAAIASVSSPAIPQLFGSNQDKNLAQNVHLIVGRSLFLKTANRLRRIYVSNPAVLQSLTSSPNEVVVTAKAPGVSSLILWDASGQSRLYTISADIDVDALRRSMQQALPADDVHIDAREGRVYLSGTVLGDAAYQEAVKLATFYSKEVVNSIYVTQLHAKQVQLKVRIVEVDRTRLDQFGLNLFSNGKNTSSVSTQQYSSIGPAQGGTTAQTILAVSNPLNFFLYNSKLNIGVTIADLEAKNILQILAEPTLTAMSGHEANFLAGGEFPYPVVQGGIGSFASVTIVFQPYGVKVKFNPTVNPDGSIDLKISPEVSALDYTNAVTISGFTVPAISTRRAETEVELQSGQSFSISGLLDHRTTVLLNKVPGIGNVPILGALFQSKNNSHSVEELVVIVTATVVDPLHNKDLPLDPQQPKMSIPNLSATQFDRTVNPVSSAGSKK
ncbi:MAG: type II and III secretion system protein family protein [Acidobacteriaceae bacterium]